MSILVYRYGLLAPSSNAELVRDQMLAAHRYRNTLTEIERGRRTAIREAESTVGDVAALESTVIATDAAAGDAARAIKAHKSEHRSRKAPSELTDAFSLAKVAKSSAINALREARARLRADPSIVARFDEINERAGELVRSARGHCGVYWGTYLLIEAEAEAARKMPLRDGATPNDPRFSRWSGEGTVGVQIQGGESGEAIEAGGDTRLRIAPRADRVREGGQAKAPGSRRDGRMRTLMVRVGSEGRAPIWAEWPMITHRPLPKGAVLKGAQVHLRKIGPREEWSVTLTVECERERLPATRAGLVAINFGWRREPEGVRVATWVGEDGATGDVVVSNHDLAGLAKPAELRSLRDDLFNLARPWATEIIHALGGAAPEWLREHTKTIAQWRSQQRLASLALRWRENRFDGDSEAFAAIESWRQRDHHLWQYEAGQSSGSLRRRTDRYRVAGARLAAKYDVAVWEDHDFSVTKKRPSPSEIDKAAFARGNEQSVAPGELRSAITNAFRGDWVAITAVDVTHECHACGKVDAFDAAKNLHHACSSCHAVWDQDANAARVLLARAIRERSGGTLTTVAARSAEKQESKWARAAALSEAKKARKGSRSQAAE